MFKLLFKNNLWKIIIFWNIVLVVANRDYKDWHIRDTLSNGHIYLRLSIILSAKHWSNQLITFLFKSNSFTNIMAKYSIINILLTVSHRPLQTETTGQLLIWRNKFAHWIFPSWGIVIIMIITIFFLWFHFLRLIKFWYLCLVHYMYSIKKAL